jgi:hypothetical protein
MYRYFIDSINTMKLNYTLNITTVCVDGKNIELIKFSPQNEMNMKPCIVLYCSSHVPRMSTTNMKRYH